MIKVSTLPTEGVLIWANPPTVNTCCRQLFFWLYHYYRCCFFLRIFFLRKMELAAQHKARASVPNSELPLPSTRMHCDLEPTLKSDGLRMDTTNSMLLIPWTKLALQNFDVVAVRVSKSNEDVPQSFPRNRNLLSTVILYTLLEKGLLPFQADKKQSQRQLQVVQLGWSISFPTRD